MNVELIFHANHVDTLTERSECELWVLANVTVKHLNIELHVKKSHEQIAQVVNTVYHSAFMC